MSPILGDPLKIKLPKTKFHNSLIRRKLESDAKKNYQTPMLIERAKDWQSHVNARHRINIDKNNFHI